MMTEEKKKKGNFPNLRFPGFEGEWETVYLEDICDKIGDGIHSTPQYDENGDYFFINGNNFVEGTIQISETTKRVTKEEAEQHNIKHLTGNTILISINGTIGNLALYNNEPVMLGKSACYINPQKREDRLFIFYQLGSKRVYNYFVSELTSSTIKNLSLKSIRQTTFHLPSIEEQNKISSLLFLIDQRISTQNKIIEKYESLIKGLSEKLFSKKLRFKDGIRTFPNWEDKRLGEISTITTGASNREDSILDGEFIFFDRSQDVRTSVRYLFDKEAIIIPGEGQKFMPKYYIGKFDLHQRTYAIFDFVGVAGKFLYYYISTKDKYLQSHAVGSTVKSLRLPIFQYMPIKLPCIEEQNKIINILFSIDDRIKLEKELLTQCEKQKEYLLQQLFI